MTEQAALTDARLYLCTDARTGRGDFEDFVDAAYAGGVDIIQLRDKSIEAAEELELLEVLEAAARRHGRLWSVNDRADIASLAGAPVLHIGQKDLPLASARKFLGDDAVIGLSTHSPEQIDAAIAASAGPGGWTTSAWDRCGPLPPSRAGPPSASTWSATPGPRPTGKTAVDAADGTVEGSLLPWFAIGGIDLGNVEQVVAGGRPPDRSGPSHHRR